jgi:hypothetical protein
MSVKHPLHHFRRHVTYANVVSLLVIVLATTGSAYGAIVMYTGTQIADSTLTGADFKDLSLNKRDLSATAYTSLRGSKGTTGATGDAGAAGAMGDTGPSGAMGKPAHSLVRYATFYSSRLRTNYVDAIPNPAPSKNWDASDYPTYLGAAATFPNLTEDYPDNDLPIVVSSNEPVLIELTGQNQTTTGTIRPTSSGLLSVTASLTFFHRNHAEAANVGGLSMHGRVRCTIRYANNGASITASSPSMGAPEWISTRGRHRISTVTITGSIPISATSTSNYNVGVSCADVDYTGSNQWWYTAGNLTAHAVYVGT